MGYIPWGVRPGEYCGLWDASGVDQKIYARLRVTQLEQRSKGQVILSLLD